ncbi:MAG TPA: hypothetical protein VH496_13225 [Mycobacterium sp.]|jgi:hypothetical protein
MAILALPVRRLILAGGIAAAVAVSPAVAVLAGPGPAPSAPVACPPGQGPDLHTLGCQNGATPGTTEQQLTECTGLQANCREQEFYGTRPPGT